ncbi:MAG TPA: PilX N-terminal domain-containing pilus assembly protein [Steroidobacter sp.]|uniref:pilus assembly PilX family protein n=1 Tax=Steroidobacter sp. TaxID=1978227 RepID=UPI002ED77BC3
MTACATAMMPIRSWMGGGRADMRSSRHRQRGVALAISLILLMLATLIGLAGVRGTNLQERMSANMYDRSLAFQRAEAALRAAEAEIASSGQIADLGGVDCAAAATAGTPCPVLPDNTHSGTNANWIAVEPEHDVNDARTPGTPEYFIQFMGTGRSEGDLDLDFYRVTARSSAPADAVGRSIVVLQTTVKRAVAFADGLNEPTITGDMLEANMLDANVDDARVDDANVDDANVDDGELDRVRIEAPGTGAVRMSWREIMN